MFKHIVAAFDGSQHAEDAIAAAGDLANRYDAELHIIHVPEVYDQAVAIGASAVVIPVKEEALKESGESMINRAIELAREAGRAPASKEIRAAPAAAAIISFADDKNADLIVSGRRGLGSVSGLFLGSVSQQLASSAECAVLTVK